jgi:aspartate/glutamate racemase
VMRAIYDPAVGIKHTGAIVSQGAKELLYKAVEAINAPIVVAGCTEISIAFAEMTLPVPWVDPMAIAAEVFFDIAYGQRTPESLIPHFSAGTAAMQALK